jgi:hypothetical protein
MTELLVGSKAIAKTEYVANGDDTGDHVAPALVVL